MMPNPDLPKTSVFIFEGPDGVGKSTAARALSDQLGWEVQHMTKPPKGFDYCTDYFRLNRLGRGVKILDRFHLGGMVYGRMCGLHPNRVTEETMLYTMLRLKYEFNAKTILMYYVSDVAYRRKIEEVHAERDEMFNVEDLIRVNGAYRRIASESLLAGSSLARLPFADILWPVDRQGYPTEEVLKAWAKYAN